MCAPLLRLTASPPLEGAALRHMGFEAQWSPRSMAAATSEWLGGSVANSYAQWRSHYVRSFKGVAACVPVTHSLSACATFACWDLVMRMRCNRTALRGYDSSYFTAISLTQACCMSRTTTMEPICPRTPSQSQKPPGVLRIPPVLCHMVQQAPSSPGLCKAWACALTCHLQRPAPSRSA